VGCWSCPTSAKARGPPCTGREHRSRLDLRGDGPRPLAGIQFLKRNGRSMARLKGAPGESRLQYWLSCDRAPRGPIVMSVGQPVLIDRGGAAWATWLTHHHEHAQMAGRVLLRRFFRARRGRRRAMNRRSLEVSRGRSLERRAATDGRLPEHRSRDGPPEHRACDGV